MSVGIESWDLRDYFALIRVASYFVSVICMSLLMSKLHVSEHMHSTYSLHIPLPFYHIKIHDHGLPFVLSYRNIRIQEEWWKCF